MRTLIASILALIVAGLVVWLFVAPSASQDKDRFQSVEPSLTEAQTRPDVLLLDRLQTVYSAFQLDDEEALYDQLFEVSNKNVLEELYLQKKATLVSGLEGGQQSIHSVELRGLKPSWDERGANFDASWQVFGQVGHGEHAHIRGNVYSAKLRLEPVDKIWKFTLFELTDVQRQDQSESQSEERP